MFHLDLCSGIGGFALAARWLGMQTIGFCEIDPFCQRVLAKNFPGVPIHHDLTTLDAGTVRGWTVGEKSEILADSDHDGHAASAGQHSGIQQLPRRPEESSGDGEPAGSGGGRAIQPRLDLITGGYPCQPFSLAGKRLGAEDDRHLWPYIAALVADLRPRYCLFENVFGHVSMGLDRVLADLETLGYTCRPVVVPACALNAPHRRDRVWLMAHADSEPERRPKIETDTGRDRGTPRVESQFGGDRLWFAGTVSSLADAPDGGVRRGSAPGQSGLVALCGEVVADAECCQGGERLEADMFGRRAVDPQQIGMGGQVGVAPNADRAGRRKQRWSVAVQAKHATIERRRRREAEPGLGISHDGIPGRLDGRLARPWDTDWEAGVPRVSDGCTDRVNKLKALGNAIVPQVAYVLMAAMTQEVI